MTHEVHNLKVKTLFWTRSVCLKVLQSVWSFVGEGLALCLSRAARRVAGRQQARYSFQPVNRFRRLARSGRGIVLLMRFGTIIWYKHVVLSENGNFLHRDVVSRGWKSVVAVFFLLARRSPNVFRCTIQGFFEGV